MTLHTLSLEEPGNLHLKMYNRHRKAYEVLGLLRPNEKDQQFFIPEKIIEENRAFDSQPKVDLRYHDDNTVLAYAVLYPARDQLATQWPRLKSILEAWRSSFDLVPPRWRYTAPNLKN